MFQTFLILISCLISTSCFSQNPGSTDSSLKPIDTQYATKDSRPFASQEVSLKVYPNPARNKVSIKVKGFDPGMVIVQIIDTKGKVWREDSRLLTNGEEEIQMFVQVKPGIYFISVSEKNKTAGKG